MQSGANCLDITLAAKLPNETSSCLQALPNPLHDACRLFHPMKRGIAENRFELPLEAEVMAVAHGDQQTSADSGTRLRDTGIGTDHASSPSSDFFRQSTVPATQIHDELAGLGRKQFQERLSQIGDEAGILSVGLRIPIRRVVHPAIILPSGGRLKNRPLIGLLSV